MAIDATFSGAWNFSFTLCLLFSLAIRAEHGVSVLNKVSQRAEGADFIYTRTANHVHLLLFCSLFPPVNARDESHLWLWFCVLSCSFLSLLLYCSIFSIHVAALLTTNRYRDSQQERAFVSTTRSTLVFHTHLLSVPDRPVLWCTTGTCSHGS